MPHNSHVGSVLEERAAERYGFQLGDCSYADGRYRTTGTPVEVKATQTAADGRFRIWENDHRKLAQQNGWYVFVIYRMAGGYPKPIAMKRKKATTVTQLVNWIEAGHRLKDGRQAKLPPEKVF